MKQCSGRTYICMVILIMVLLIQTTNAQETVVIKISSSAVVAKTTSATGDNKKKDEEKKPRTPDESKKVDSIEKTIDFGIQDDRKKAIDQILSIKDAGLKKRLNSKLIDVIKDETDSEVLVKAITVLGEMNISAAVPALIEKIDHPSEEVRTAAVYSIKNLKGTSAKGTLIDAFKKQDLSKDSLFSEAIIRTLGDFRATEIQGDVEKALENGKTGPATREHLVMFLGNLEASRVKGTLLKIYKDEEEELTIRSYAVSSLAKLGVGESVSDIKATLTAIESYPFKKRQRYYNLYMYSVAALARLGDKDAIPKLINALRSNNPQVRLKAVSLIKELKDKRTIDILKYKMKNDQSDKVRKAAEEALKELGVDVKDKD